MSQIKAVVFDAGRVLVNFDFTPFLDKLAEFSPYSNQEIVEKIWYSEPFVDYQNGKISAQEFYEKIIKGASATGPDFETFCDLWKTVITTPNEAIVEILSQLKPEIRAMVLSDTSAPHWEVIEKFPLIQKFFSDKNNLILSFEVGACKPAEKIFQEAPRRVGCSFAECIFIDDNPKNTAAFRDLGGNAIDYNCQINTIEELRKELAKYDVLK